MRERVRLQSEGCQSWHDGFLPADECALFNLSFIDIATQGDLPCTPRVSCVDRCGERKAMIMNAPS